MRATRQKWVNNEANQLTGRPVRYLVNRLTDVCEHDDDDDDYYFDDDDDDFYFDDDDDDDDDNVQRFSSPNSCDPVRLKCQTPTNRPFLQDSFKWDHHHHHHHLCHHHHPCHRHHHHKNIVISR